MNLLGLQMKSGWFQIAIVLIACSAGPVWAWQAKVIRITDGDSLWVRPADGGAPVELRIDGIDAPEICQSGGQAARKALAARLMGRTVDVDTRRQDDYDRALASVFLDGEDMGAWMVSQGHAWAYRQASGAYLALQARAQSAALGLFADRNALPPRVFRKLNGPCYL